MQKEGSVHVVGNLATNDFYQIPDVGARILAMLGSGETKDGIRSRLAREQTEPVDVESFIDDLHGLGLVFPEDEEPPNAPGRIGTRDGTLRISRRVARTIVSWPLMTACTALVIYAAAQMVLDPRQRINLSAFYFEQNRTILFVLVTVASLLLALLHEFGHVIAAARQGIPATLGVGTRMWNIVAEAEITGVLALSKSQRYFPMLAGMLVDVLCISLLTIFLRLLLNHGAGSFTRQLVQAAILSRALGVLWQFNIFVKTDIYYLLCTHFSYPDLDADARAYMGRVLHRATSGLFGTPGASRTFGSRPAVVLFSLIWILGRTFSLGVLLCVFLPTMWRYGQSAFGMLEESPASMWQAFDLGIYLCLTLTMVGTGMYMWLRQK